MLSFFKKITLVFIGLISVQSVFALEINQNNYETYIGDVDGDGDGDYYFKQKPWTLILHGDIATPLLLKGTKHFVVYNNAGVLSAPQSFTLVDADLATKLNSGALRLATISSDIFAVASGAGQNTLLIRGSTASTPALLIKSNSNIDLPTVLMSYSTNNYNGISDRNVQLQIKDINGDGLNDIELTTAANEQWAYLADSNGVMNTFFEMTPSSLDKTRALAGSFDVTSSGQATYKIPVITAPGSAGLVPNVSLNYSSGGGNGLLGLGWSLSASGAISRCRQTEGVDGVAKPITWTNEDRFCLNGERLLLTSGSYGVTGSTYKTEVDSFARVTAVGGSSGHPDYFTVEYKDGMIETYGNTTDSSNSKNQLASSNSNTVLDWVLSKRSDSAGNKILYKYVKDSDGQRLDTIDFAFGNGSTRGAYLQFLYQDRNDPISGYVAGQSYRTGKRLYGVKSFNGAFEIRGYYLTYNQATAYTANDKISRINKIQECVGTYCSPATEFEWELPDYQLAAATSIKNFPSGISYHTMGDFNGDGLQDIAWFDTAVAGHYENSGMLLKRPLRYAYGKIDVDGKFIFENQLFANGSYTGPSLNSKKLKAVDLNNDGRMDLAFDIETRVNAYDVGGSTSLLLSVPMADGSWRLSVGPTGQPSYHPYGIPLAMQAHSEISADVNADGILDAIGWPVGELPWDGEIADGGYTPKPYVYIAKNNFGIEQHDLKHILVDPSVKNDVSFENQPDADFRSKMDSAPINYLTQLSGDFNGDGMMDITSYSYAIYGGCHVQDEGYRFCNGGFTLSLSTMYTIKKASNGDYELHYFPSSIPSLFDDWDIFFDANGDGLSDLLARDYSEGWNIRINTGQEIGQRTPIGVNFNGFNIPLDFGNQELILVDINADGYQDVVWQQPVNNSALTGTSYVKVKYWDPSLNQFTTTEQTLGTLPYKIINNYPSTVSDPRYSAGNYKFKTDRFNMTDVNGDGVPDLVTTPNTQTGAESIVTVRLATNVKKNANKIIAIKNGLGEQKKIQYGRVNENIHYNRLDGISLPGSEQKCEDVIQTNSDDTQYVEHMCWTEYSGAVNSAAFYQAINDPWSDLAPEEQSLRPASPVLEAFGPMSIVTDVEVITPSASKANPQQIDTTATAKLSYYYGHAKMQAGGRGFLGFKFFSVVNRETGIRTETEYRQDWPYLGMPRKVKTFTASGKKLNEQENIYGLVNCYDAAGNANSTCVNNMSNQVDATGTGALGAVKPFLRKSISNTYALKDNGLTQGDLISTATQLSRNDSSGNQIETSSSLNGLGLPVINNSTINIYDYSGSTWSMQQGRLQRMSVTANDATYGAVTRTSSFSYYTSGTDIGLLKTETVEPDNAAYTVTTTHSYNQGNRVKSLITADEQTRQSEVEYDSLGRYVDKTYGFFTNGTNPDAPIRRLVSQVVARDNYGAPTEVRSYVDASNFTTSKTKTTPFGMAYYTEDSSGAYSRQSIGISADTYGICPSDTKTWVLNLTAGGGKSLQCNDLLGRVRRAATIAFDGTNWSVVDTEYDKLGRALRTSAPYFSNSSERYWTTQDYDILGRIVATNSPYKNTYVTTTTRYNNLDVEIKNPKDQIRIEKRDLAGKIIEVIDPNNGSTKFAYDARGNMREMKDPANNTTTVTYDLRDRKVAMSDPDKGNQVYQYNRFGDLTCQMDGKGQTSVNRYDIAGRLFSRTDRFAGGNCSNPTGSIEKYTQWNYDTAAYGLGDIASVFDSNSVGGAAQFQQSFVYDNLGRVSSTTTSMPGHLNQTSSHYEKITYDQFGRPDVTFDAARASQTFTTNGIKNVYNPQGYLESVRDAFTQKNYYQVSQMNARGSVTSALYGNGVTQKADYYPENGLTKRLRTDRALGGLPVQYIDLDWDELGNLNWREETGTAGESVARNIRESFVYDNLNRLKTWNTSGNLIANETANYNNIDNITDKTGIGNYLYGNQCGAGTNAGPHALCRAGTTNYNYDLNGNMLNDSAGRTMTYTSYDLPSEISKAGHKTEFSYGPSRARYKRVDTANNQITTTLYLGSVEKVYYSDGVIEWKRSIAGVGLFTQRVNSSGTLLSEAQRYLIKDHLGSLSLITDEIGAVEQSNYFDPWGKERKIVTSGSVKQWLADNTNFRMANKPITTRGFTDHEQLAEVGLIHMNGRIYDGALGRFVQADPIIQDPLRVQSLNRYSYVWNNPLNATDPSGFDCASVAQDGPPTECEPPEIVLTGEKSKPQKDNRSGFTYKVTDKAAMNSWLNANNMTIESFDKMMQSFGVSKASGSSKVGISPYIKKDKDGKITGILIPATVENADGGESEAAGEAVVDFLFPRTAYMAEYGEEGTWGDAAAGFGRQSYNSVIGTLGLFNPAFLTLPIVFPSIEANITPKQASGAALFENVEVASGSGVYKLLSRTLLRHAALETAPKRLAAYLKFSSNWSTGSLSTTLTKYAKGIRGKLSDDGVKTNYINKSLNIKIMVDNENNYFRIYDMTRKAFLDVSGNIPKTGALKGSDAKNFLQEQTHVRNVD